MNNMLLFEIKHRNRKFVIEKKYLRNHERLYLIKQSRFINFAVSATINFLWKRKCNTVHVQCLYPNGQ